MTVDVLDLAAADTAALASTVDAALRGTGFLVVQGHGVPAEVVQAAYAASRAFFGLPQDVKERWHIDRQPLRRGFDPIGWQALDPSRPPDLKESFYLGVEAFGPNPWPDEARVPGFRAALQAYSGEMERLARRLMALFEQALGLPRGALDAYMREPMCTTRLLHYPPQPVSALPGQIGCGAHTDWGALTLLSQDDAGGLQVQGSDGHWLDVPPVDGSFVVNVGDMTQRWTNDRWRSTLHRVVNRHAGRDRFSIAYFFDLDRDARIEPLPTCVSPGHPARYGPLTAGEHLEAMYRRTTVGA